MQRDCYLDMQAISWLIVNVDDQIFNSLAVDIDATLASVKLQRELETGGSLFNMTAYFVACSVLADILFVLTTTSSLHKLRVYAFTPIDLGLAGNGKEKDTCRNGQQVTSQQLCHLIETGINQ